MMTLHRVISYLLRACNSFHNCWFNC